MEANGHAPFCCHECRSESHGVFPARRSPETSEALLTRIREEFRKKISGFSPSSAGQTAGCWDSSASTVSSGCPRSRSDVEVGWRQRVDVRGDGYAPKTAAACLDYAGKRGVREIISFTALANLRSRRVTQKIGRVCDREFAHPASQEGHPLKRHILYRLICRQRISRLSDIY